MKKIIINADDFGLTKTISDEIIKVYKIGNLSSTSLMVNTPGRDYAINLARENPDLGIGLHFNLTEGFALTGVSSITNSEGKFLDKMKLILYVILKKIDIKDVYKELKAQYEYIIKAGLIPSHIDSHQHIHMNPRIFKLVADFAKEKNIPIRITFPQTIIRNNGIINYKKRIKQYILQYASIKNSRYANKIGLKFNKSFNSIFDFHPFQMPEKKDYLNLLNKSFSDKHELMIHLYKESKELKEFYKENYRKKNKFFKIAIKELSVLSKDFIFNNYQLITFRDLY